LQLAPFGAILFDMKALLAAGLLCATLAFADVPADRTADRMEIAQVVKSLSTANPVSVLFTADADNQLDRLTQPPGREPWSEVFRSTNGRPSISVQSIRFLTPDVALVDAVSTQIGSTAFRRVLVWLVMKKEGADWKIASLKLPAVSDFV
jgi:hypothetical protein